MKNLLLIAHFCDYGKEKTNNRFNYLYSIFKKSYCTELITSNYSHRDKKFRIPNICGDNITLIKEPAYNKNISLKRFYSHYKMSIELKKYLKNREIPDIIYCSVPSLDIGYVVSQYAVKHNIPLIIDVQDLWPEAFKMVFRIPIFSDLIFFPMECKARKIYKSANKIVTVSETYAKKVKEINNQTIVAYLGTNLNFFDSIPPENLIIKPRDEFWIAYIGTLGHSYNLKYIMDAIDVLQETFKIRFIIMGDGPLKKSFEQYAIEKNICCDFKGKLPYQEMVALLKICDIAVNPIKSGSAGSIINKVGDYAAAGLPVINTQESQEYCNLLEEWKAGFNCKNNNVEELASKIKLLILNKDLRNSMGNANRKLAENYFDRNYTYKKIEDAVSELLESDDKNEK